MINGSATICSRHARIERRQRVLKDHLHVAPQDAEIALRALHGFDAMKLDAAARRRRQTDDRARERGLAAAGFTHQPDGFAAPYIERHAVDSAQRGLARPR
ncbi:hypothetical protein HDG37_002807 [Paraburkholderia sp. MM5384-R2]|nr:hypothetical protein [Paraburkholderia sp. MM5384-R2]